MVTTIQITDETWAKLSSLKLRPSQTFDEIINNALDEAYLFGEEDPIT